MTDLTPGERFTQTGDFDQAEPHTPHIWRTLGWTRVAWEPGRSSVAWDAQLEYSFPTANGPVLQGGLVTAIIDAAMAGAVWTVLDLDQTFLTADLRIEFLRPTTPGPLRADGAIVRRTRKVVFCSGELYDADGRLLAAGRCTQIVLADAPRPAPPGLRP